MSNLGFHSLFHRTASFHGIRVARFFIERGKGLFSPEALISEKKSLFKAASPTLKSFDALIFTVAYELDYLNIIRMLRLSEIPPLSCDREERFPLIITGGIAPSANPLPVSVFCDVVCVGDMEDLLERILEILFRNNFRKSDSTIREIRELDGVYRDEREWKRWIKKDITLPAHSVILTQRTEFPNRFLIELVRGCTQSCSFCMTRKVNRPVRIVPEELITRTVRRAIQHTKKVGLMAPLLSDHPDLVEIVKKINKLGFLVSFSSLRADTFSDQLAKLLKANRQYTVTFAPETGSYALRKKIGKALNDEDLFHAVSLAAENSVKRFRYYMMYGLPEETESDIRNIAILAKKTVAMISQKGCVLHLSINPFIPKKGTAFEKAIVYPPEYYTEMQKLLKEDLRGIPNISVKFGSIRLLYLQYKLSIGTEETGFLLNKCFLRGSMRTFIGPREMGG